MPASSPYHDASTPDAPVRGFLHRAENPNPDGLILTHGAGANCQAPLLIALAEAFCASGVTVLRCDLPFRQLRRTGPPPRGSAERDQAGLRAAIAALRREILGAPGLDSETWENRIFLGGHSYGGRQASMLAAADPSLVEALLLLSYPLHPPKQPGQMRTSHFAALKTPALFVHGARDGFATEAEMEAALKLIPARKQLLEVPSAGHELMNPRNRAELLQRIVETFLSFANQA
jgi:predicted alpha/beta-hydrolase family hydrolase